MLVINDCVLCLCTVKPDQDEETLKDELAQEYRIMQTQQMQQQPASSDVLFRKKSSARGLKKFFGKYEMRVYFVDSCFHSGILCIEIFAFFKLVMLATFSMYATRMFLLPMETLFAAVLGC